MKHLTNICATFLLIFLSQMIYGNPSDRIKFVDIDFYSRNTQDFNLKDSIAKNGKIVLNHHLANRFGIQYSVDTLSDNEMVKYKIEGFDREWITDNEGRNIMLTNLPTGRYILQMGIFHKEIMTNEKSLEIIINPPFWKTFPFRIILLLLVIVPFIILINWNVRLRNRLRNTNTYDPGKK